MLAQVIMKRMIHQFIVMINEVGSKNIILMGDFN